MDELCNFPKIDVTMYIQFQNKNNPIHMYSTIIKRKYKQTNTVLIETP